MICTIRKLRNNLIFILNNKHKTFRDTFLPVLLESLNDTILSGILHTFLTEAMQL